MASVQFSVLGDDRAVIYTHAIPFGVRHVWHPVPAFYQALRGIVVDVPNARSDEAEERDLCLRDVCQYCAGDVQSERDSRGRWYHVGKILNLRDEPTSLTMKFDCVGSAIRERWFKGDDYEL